MNSFTVPIIRKNIVLIVLHYFFIIFVLLEIKLDGFDVPQDLPNLVDNRNLLFSDAKKNYDFLYKK